MMGMRSLALGAATVVVTATAFGLDRRYADLEHPAHAYWKRPLEDPFTELLPDLRSGAVELDYQSDKAFVASLLEALDIPVSSQLLVFSATSLQQPRISKRNPRALYFNENVYVGWVPGAQVEVISIDPNLGAIFYIFGIPRRAQALRVERADECMNCHARSLTGRTPGLTVKSVIAGPNGGSLDAFRLETTGHSIPFEERFGGWHVTGRHGIQEHWGNLFGRFSKGELLTEPNAFGERFDPDTYPVSTSDVLAHLIFEHDIGFNNRAIEATYAARAFQHEDGENLTAEHEAELERLAHALVRYLLFADEVPLPSGGVQGDPAFIQAFLATRRATPEGRSLKELDLKTRLFRHRCSYMIYSVAFQGLHPLVKNRVLGKLHAALAEVGSDEYAYIEREEKRTIDKILRGTLKAYAEWR